MKFPRLICTLVSGLLLLGVFACKKPTQPPAPEKAAEQTAVPTPVPEPQPETIPVPPVKKSSSEEIQSLLKACREGNLEKVKELIDAGVDVNGVYTPPDPCRRGASGCSVPPNQTPLLVASETGQLMIVKELLQYGASVDKCNNYKETPLILASLGGHNEVAKVLLKAGANVNTQSLTRHMTSHGPRKYTALYFASANGHLSVVKTLLSAGAIVNMPGSENVLAVAIRRGHLPIVKKLKAAGAKK